MSNANKRTLEQRIVAKAEPTNFGARFREIVSDPLNLLIQRDYRAGLIDNDGYVYLHNGNRVPPHGNAAYYGDFSKILEINRGVHEPLEEFCFQETLKKISDKNPAMIELGSYWAHYSMWFLKCFPDAECIMVEENEYAMEIGRKNFENNGFNKGQFICKKVCPGSFELDEFSKENNINNVSILHCDIQGYEIYMLDAASHFLSQKIANYIFLSTHSQLIHESSEATLESFGYRIEVSSDFDNHTTCFDGFILASSPSAPQVFEDFSPLGRNDIISASRTELVSYLTDTLK